MQSSRFRMQHSRFHSRLRADVASSVPVPLAARRDLRIEARAHHSSSPPDDLRHEGDRDVTRDASRPRARPRLFFHGEDLAKTEARMVVARRSGSGSLLDLRKRGSPQNSANGWIRDNVVKVIVSLSFARATAIVME